MQVCKWWSKTKQSCCFSGCKGSTFLGAIIKGAAHRPKLLEMQHAFPDNCISSSMNFWYMKEMEYGSCAIGGPVAGVSILNRLVFLTYLEDLDMMLSNSFSSQEKSLSLTSCGTCTCCNITNCLFELLCSCWLLDSVGIVGRSVGLFVMSSLWYLSVLVHDILLTLVFLISIGFNAPNRVALVSQTLLYVVLCMGILNTFGYLCLIL